MFISTLFSPSDHLSERFPSFTCFPQFGCHLLAFVVAEEHLNWNANAAVSVVVVVVSTAAAAVYSMSSFALFHGCLNVWMSECLNVWMSASLTKPKTHSLQIQLKPWIKCATHSGPRFIAHRCVVNNCGSSPLSFLRIHLLALSNQIEFPNSMNEWAPELV